MANGNGKAQRPTLAEEEERILEEFPIGESGSMHRLMARIAARQNLQDIEQQDIREGMLELYESHRVPCGTVTELRAQVAEHAKVIGELQTKVG